MRPLGCTETSAKNCHCTLRNFPEESRFHIARCRLTESLVSSSVIGPNEAIWPASVPDWTMNTAESLPMQLSCRKSRTRSEGWHPKDTNTHCCLFIFALRLSICPHNSFVCISLSWLRSCVPFVCISFVPLFLSTFLVVLYLCLFLFLSFI
jgi:hypothetical protein